jgi:hypothetical protein
MINDLQGFWWAGLAGRRGIGILIQSLQNTVRGAAHHSPAKQESAQEIATDSLH